MKFDIKTPHLELSVNSVQELFHLAQRGMLSPSDHVRSVPDGEWLRADDHPELRDCPFDLSQAAASIDDQLSTAGRHQLAHAANVPDARERDPELSDDTQLGLPPEFKSDDSDTVGASWFVRLPTAHRPQGPLTNREVAQLILSRQVLADTQAYQVGAPSWQAVSEITLFAPFVDEAAQHHDDVISPTQSPLLFRSLAEHNVPRYVASNSTTHDPNARIDTGVVDTAPAGAARPPRIPHLVRWGVSGAAVGLLTGLALALVLGLSVVLLITTGVMIGGGAALLGGAVWLSQQVQDTSGRP